MYNVRYIFYITLFFLYSCGLNDNLAPIPTYLILKDPIVNASDLVGGGTHKITDVWVYSDGQLHGIFQLPAKVPIIATGAESEITILAGIRKNGIFDEPAFYPFYQSITTKIVLEELKEIVIPLEFKYAENAIFELIANFEQENLFEFDLDFNSATNLELSAEDANLGLQSGKVVLNSTQKVVEVATTETFFKSTQIVGNAYIEMDYKGTAEIGVGLVTYDDFSPGGILSYKVVVVPRENWNKIYIDVTAELSSPRLKSYKLALGFTLPLAEESAEAFVDNIKLVRF